MQLIAWWVQRVAQLQLLISTRISSTEEHITCLNKGSKLSLPLYNLCRWITIFNSKQARIIKFHSINRTPSLKCPLISLEKVISLVLQSVLQLQGQLPTQDRQRGTNHRTKCLRALSRVKMLTSSWKKSSRAVEKFPTTFSSITSYSNNSEAVWALSTIHKQVRNLQSGRFIRSVTISLLVEVENKRKIFLQDFIKALNKICTGTVAKTSYSNRTCKAMQGLATDPTAHLKVQEGIKWAACIISSSIISQGKELCTTNLMAWCKIRVTLSLEM